MLDHRTLWRTDFTAVPPAERRVARFALQLVSQDPQVRRVLRKREVLSALWQLTLPLFNPAATAAYLATLRDQDQEWLSSEKSWRNDRDAVIARRIKEASALAEGDAPGVPRPPTPPADPRQDLEIFFTRPPGRVLRRLAQDDGEAPVSATVALLGETLRLTATEVRLLDYLEHRSWVEPLRFLLGGCGDLGGYFVGRINQDRLAGLLGLDRGTLRTTLARRAPLRALGLAETRRDEVPLEDFLNPSALLCELLETAPPDQEALLALLIEPAPAGTWRLDAFPHLAAETERLQGVLRQAATTGAIGVNALFHGAPGTGKTELARTLAAACGLRAYQVCNADEDEEGLGREGRLSAYLLAQRLLARRRDAVLIFDEVEDVFETTDNHLALLRGHGVTGSQKGWMNRILEENPVPAIWITNATHQMDPAFLRRFLLPVAFVTPPRSVRRRLVESHLGDCNLPPTLLDELAADTALAPAQLGAARRLLTLRPRAPAEPTVRGGVAAIRTLLHGAPTPRRRAPATAFDVAFLNLAGGITPSQIARALARQGHGNLCLYGPPGTGKTAFAEVLAEALDRELVVRQASDLIAPFLGETEQNLARLFRDTDPTQTVLLLDEVDSFLTDRRQARYSWERTQVNELLQQMERYDGIFIAATNLMAGIDGAALRRFDFKLHFRALTAAQRLALFAREALGDPTAVVAPELVGYLEGLPVLTPGDFANVCRQRTLLVESLTPEQFLRRLAAECRLKQVDDRQVA